MTTYSIAPGITYKHMHVSTKLQTDMFAPKPSAYSSSIYSVNVSNIRLGMTDLILSLGLGEYLNKLHPFLPIVQHGNKSYGGF